MLLVESRSHRLFGILFSSSWSSSLLLLMSSSNCKNGGWTLPFKMDYSSQSTVCLLEKSVWRSCGHCYAGGQSPLTLKSVCVEMRGPLLCLTEFFSPLINFGDLTWKSTSWCFFMFAMDSMYVILHKATSVMAVFRLPYKICRKITETLWCVAEDECKTFISS